MLTRTRATAGTRRRGLSLVELMIGVTVGLLVVAGALTLMARNLGSSRQLLAEARLNQDMRNAMDLITRDLRRAGYWGNALTGTFTAAAGSSVVRNPYAAVDHGEASLAYGFSRDAAENDRLDANERFGFRIDGGKLQMQDGAGWRDMTDAATMTIVPNGLAIVASRTTLPLGHLCARACPPGTPNCPSVQVRSYTVTLTALSAQDTAVMRTLRTNVRVRNDSIAGQCPV